MSSEQADYGMIVARQESDLNHPVRVGDELAAYVLTAPLPPTVAPFAKKRGEGDPHAAARQLAGDVAGLIKSGSWRTLAVHRCRGSKCKQRQVLATEAVSAEGVRWALVHHGESVPPAFNGGVSSEMPPKAWPLHREPSGAPHVEIVKCQRCRSTYALAVTEDSVTLVPVTPRYGGRVGSS